MEILWLLGGIIALLLINSIVITLTNTKRDELIIEKKQLEERLKATEIKLKESGDRSDELYKGESPKEKEKRDETEVTQLKRELAVVTEKYNTLKADYERNIGYPIFEGAKKQKEFSRTISPPSPIVKPERPTTSEIKKQPPTARGTAPILETDIFAEFIQEKYSESQAEIAELKLQIKEDQELFEEGLAQMSRVFSASCNLDALLERVVDGRLNNAFATDTHFSKIEIVALVSPSKEDATEPYHVTLSDCTCKSYTKGNPKKLPCKHMVYLAYELGILQIDREKCRIHFKYSIENATKVAPLPKPKKEAENAKRKLSQL